jgi:hypothetical protein
MSRRRITDGELLRLERMAGLNGPIPVEILRKRAAAKLRSMAVNVTEPWPPFDVTHHEEPGPVTRRTEPSSLERREPGK